MAAITPDPARIRAFENAAAFERWLSAQHARETELYLRLYKKGSGVPSVSYAEALDVALCWGWIDGLKKSYDAQSFLQRFTPRKPKSVWSKINCAHVERLIESGRMTPHGLVHVDAAKADGRWDAAYAGSATLELPPELLRAIEADPAAKRQFAALDRANRYALGFRLQRLRTEAARAKKIAEFVAMLREGRTLHPQRPARTPRPKR
jgi:uncharacterized protein YdeI (YjbR/CyaY-like superfamily)